MTTNTESPKAPKGLELLRKPFEAGHISKLPKPSRAQTDEVKADYRAGMRCDLCRGWHHPDAMHVDYVGHAAVTNRLLDVDPAWHWEPFALTADGLPAFDDGGGLWIKLTILGVTRCGYGAADNKSGGDATKEIIGDALRNAAIRFGVALDLWHKGDLHGKGNSDETGKEANQGRPVDIENLKTAKGRAFVADFPTADAAVNSAKESNYVSEEDEITIRDIWDAAQKGGGDE